MARPIKSFWLFLLGLLGLHAGPASAALDMVLCHPDAPGDSTRAVGCIDVLAWSWGVSNSGGVTPKANIQDLSFTKYTDSASDELLKMVVTGSVSKGVVQLRVYKNECGTGCLATEPYQTLHVRVSSISSVSTGGSGGEDKLTENVSINFSEFSYCFRTSNAGVLGAAQCTAWSATSGLIAPF